MARLRRGLAITSLLSLSLAALFASAAGPVDVADARFSFCITCHGANAQGNPGVAAPRLGGLPAWHIENQLKAFQAGWRGTAEGDEHGDVMRTMALALVSDEAVRDAAAWAAALDAPPPAATLLGGDPTAGKALYAPCAACHGAEGRGKKALGAPPLAGQNDWYLETQLEHYLAGRRGFDPADNLGQQMRALAGTVSTTQQRRDLLAYLATLSVEAP
ncbi:MAG: c-type cytochrome [Pseudomonadales bacterium]|nr:c-type cytochrome [Pseudomonadales bacterium]